jgi:hypothetical protein
MLDIEVYTGGLEGDQSSLCGIQAVERLPASK